MQEAFNLLHFLWAFTNDLIVFCFQECFNFLHFLCDEHSPIFAKIVNYEYSKNI